MQRLERIASHIAPASASSATDLVSLLGVPAHASAPQGFMAGQVAIVTGAGQGIGEATALLIAKQGGKVVVSDIDDSKGKAVAKAITDLGGAAISVNGDVTDPAFPQRLIDETVKAFGKINHIVNNAGYTWDGMIHKTTDKQWQAIIDCHVTGPFRIIRAAAPYMRDAGKQEITDKGVAENRCIVNVSSTSGLHGNIGQANYAAAKAGVIGLTKTVAKEWGPMGVRCNTIAFGLIETRLTASKKDGAHVVVDGQKVALGVPTPMKDSKAALAAIPLNRPGKVDDAAGAVLMLVSPFASYVTGHTLECTGGLGI